MRTRATRGGLLARSITWLVPLTLVAGCSHGGHGETPAASVARARDALDAAASVHFRLSSLNVPSGGTRLVGGEGVAARPAAFRGKLSVLIGTGTVSVDMVSVGGTVYAKLPFASGFEAIDPARFGLTDPALLLGREHGLSRLLASMTGATSAGEARIGDDVVVKVTGSIPGAVVGDVLTDADPGVPVAVVGYIVKTSGQLRRAELTGPLYAKGRSSTFQLVLDRYGDKVSISAPATG